MFRIFAAALALTTVCGGQSRSEETNALGFGLMVCREAVPLFDQPAYRQAFQNWTAGFMTGVNAMSVARDAQYRDLKGVSTDLMLESLRSFCSDNPTAQVVKAAEVFWMSLPSKKWAAP